MWTDSLKSVDLFFKEECNPDKMCTFCDPV